MSKGNLFLGFGRGSVGDVTFYRTNGEQIARARNRKPSNPRSDRQLFQRAVLATISRVYQLGHAIFDHSFQGYRRGAENQRRFQSLNLNALRQQLAADLSAGTTLARVAAPGISAPTANRYIISEGTYPQTLITWSEESQAFEIPSVISSLDATVAQWAQERGVLDGDIYTIVAIGVSPTDFAYEYVDGDGRLVEQASVGRAAFQYLQLRVKEGVQTSAALFAGATLADVFDIYQSTSGQVDPTALVTEAITFANLVGNPDWNNGAVGVIRSREDSDLRSSTTMQLVGDGTFGITAPWLLDVWRRESSIGGADVILEGSNFGPAVRPDLSSQPPGSYYVAGTFSAGGRTFVDPCVSLDSADLMSFDLALAPTGTTGLSDVWCWNGVQAEESLGNLSEQQAQQLADAIFAAVAERYSGTGAFSVTASVSSSAPSDILGSL